VDHSISPLILKSMKSENVSFLMYSIELNGTRYSSSSSFIRIMSCPSRYLQSLNALPFLIMISFAFLYS